MVKQREWEILGHQKVILNIRLQSLIYSLHTATYNVYKVGTFMKHDVIISNQL